MRSLIKLVAGLLLVSLVVACSSRVQNASSEDPSLQQERQERIQREQRAASERLDRQLD